MSKDFNACTDQADCTGCADADARGRGCVLLIEDEPVFAKNVKLFLTRKGYSVFHAESGESALEMLERIDPGLVLLDYGLPGMDGLDVLENIRARSKRTKVVMLTGNGSEHTGVNALRGGVADYLIKPVVLSTLLPLVERMCDERAALDARERVQEIAHLHEMDAGVCREMIGDSAPMRALRTRIARVLAAGRHCARSEQPAVLITGETGTGKELVARALHFEGMKAPGPFVEVNCAGIPAQLLESELFGHEPGAFTDAKQAKAGLIEAAAGGTLFLDEIGDLDLAAQAKLLKVIEERKVRRLGGVQERNVDVRFLAATSHDLERRVREGRFRADLYFCLSVVRIDVPPLRDREDDVVRLARQFVKVYRERYGRPSLCLGRRAITGLRAHGWLGNVRELKHAIELAVILAEGPVITEVGCGEPMRRNTLH